MAKPKLTQIRPTEQPAAAPRTIPLSEITITWPPLRDFEGEPEAPITISGARLAQLVAWLARTSPHRLTPPAPSATPDVWDRDAVWLRLEGLSWLIKGYGESTLGSETTPAVCFLLSGAMRELTARLAAIDDTTLDLEGATVTLGAPAPEAK
jgi:hypothetical protein